MKQQCVEWQGGRHKYGYGVKWHKGKQQLTHRLAYCEAIGLDITDIKGRCVLHTCDNPPCVNPDHLWLGTRRDNAQDRDRKGRGDWSGRAKLTASQVLSIRADTRLLREIADDYGVSLSAVSLIKKRKTWKHIRSD